MGAAATDLPAARADRADAPGADRAGAPDDVLAELGSWHRELRAQFPILTGSPGTAYLDSAATSQKPAVVLDAVSDYLRSSNSNAGRGTYPWANRTTALVEAARERVKAFLDDPEPDRSGVHLVSGATAGLRAVALDWLVGTLRDGDEIVVPFADHQANALPWLEAREALHQRGIRIEVKEMPYESASRDYDQAALAGLVSDRTRLVAATHVHHVYGADMNVQRIRRTAGPDAVLCLDAAQGVGHVPLSVRELDVDFVVFSGHKSLALPGSGAVWARNARGPRFTPGGWAGSPNTTGAVSLTAALDWLDAAGTGRIARWTTALGARLTEGLCHLESYEVLGCQHSLAAGSGVQRRCGIVTFRHREISSHELGFILASHELLVRADGHCQGRAGEETSSVRASLHVYSTPDEVDRLLDVLASLDTPRGRTR